MGKPAARCNASAAGKDCILFPKSAIGGHREASAFIEHYLCLLLFHRSEGNGSRQRPLEDLYRRSNFLLPFQVIRYSLPFVFAIFASTSRQESDVRCSEI